MSIVPLRPNVRYYCSECDAHYFEHQRESHLNCNAHIYCSCGRAFMPGDDNCPMCGAEPPVPLPE